MVMDSLETEKARRAETRKALIREKIALSKLEHLKLRYDAVFNELATAKSDLLKKDKAFREMQDREAESARLALHWRTEFYTQMDALDETKRHLALAEKELELAWEQTGVNGATAVVPIPLTLAHESPVGEAHSADSSD